MKYFSFVATVIVVVLSFALTGCEKCKTCSYNYTENGEEKLYRSQVCGKSADLTSFEDFVATQADTLNVKYSCIND